jgi:GDPmannose 4,6-dehydratase
MLQQDTAEDFVIATGEQHSVRDFVTLAATELGISIDWQGKGQEERGIVASAPTGSAVKPGHCITAVDPRYFRPAEVETLLGDPAKARAKLGWSPKIPFAGLVSEMMAADLASAQRDHLVKQAGFSSTKHRE